MSAGRAGAPARGHRTVDRVAAILEAATRSPDTGVRLSTLAEELDVPKSSLHGLLKGLLAVGYLAERRGGYILGPGLHALLGGVERPTVADIALGPMEELTAEFDETVLLGHMIGDHVVYVAGVESRQLIRYSPRLNQRRPVLPTSMGKVFIAELQGDERRAYVDAHIENRRRRRVLAAELEEVRRSGVAVNRNETLPGLCGVASGVRERGKLIACLSVVGPTDRLFPQLKEIERAIRVACDAVSAQLP